MKIKSQTPFHASSINVIDYSTEVPSLDNNWLYGMQVMNTLF